MTEAEHEAAVQALLQRVALAINDGKVFPTDYARRLASVQATNVLAVLTHDDLTTWQEWVKRPFPAAEPMVG